MCDITDSELKSIRSRLTKIEADTSEMIDMFNALQGGFRVLQMIGRLARPFGYISAAAASIAMAYAKIKGGGS